MLALTLGRIMTPNVATVSPRMTLREAARLLDERRVSGAPVVEHGRVVGVVSNADIRAAVLAPRSAPEGELAADSAGPEDPFDAICVREIMSRRIYALPRSADLRAAALLMHAGGVHRILVMEGDALFGVVSALDLARATAERGWPGAGDAPAPDASWSRPGSRSGSCSGSCSGSEAVTA